ncbi:MULTISPECIES: hypothetical protein [unclassified Rhodococcus (in: high G+C Gram-positive bacteria)]|uniref:hypothetical protein n=1 Tax=unclassified Rhodococcus (in: high G+C Gram-positive bacteria) TaxID=192944 RepID=UPI000690E367|nr:MULTISPECIES: hypothetical protein [unclassified Rhodococcus (in: high G+C Gram-positive bacteria)]MDQ1182861.1 hypothetical protein [Rhodococcus sp. SORGH_AS_0301]MDQ1199946.1 hypothetical protein [Rhodococcus sp. SORGH_AS_0303]
MSQQTSALTLRAPVDTRSERSEFLRSTPVRLLAVGLLVVATLVTTALVTTLSVSDRQRTLELLLARTEPLSDAAQNLYVQLSVADATAATAFLSGGLEPGDVRGRYTDSLGAAAGEVVRASTGLASDDATSRQLLATISTNLPLYAGIIETARTNNRVGNPVGSAYLAEASTLMQNTILPWAEELHAEKSGDVSDAQRQFATPPWSAFVVLGITVLVLVGAQMFLSRKTKRTVNVGFAGATVGVVLLLGWMLVAGLISSTATDRALVRGAEPLDLLTTSRILAQQARADETIGMTRRGGFADYEKSYSDAVSGLADTLGTLAHDDDTHSPRMDDARALVSLWTSSHDRMNASLDVGDFDTAVTIATGTAAGDSSDVFGRLDSALVEEIEASRASLRDDVQRASGVLAGLTVGTGIVCGLAVLAVVGGMWSRIREYL